MEDIRTTDNMMKSFGVCKQTLLRWRKKGMPFIRLNGNIMYATDDVQKWIETFKENKVGKKNGEA